MSFEINVQFPAGILLAALLLAVAAVALWRGLTKGGE